MYLGHCHQILYKSIAPFFSKRFQISYLLHARMRLRPEWRPCADEHKQVNKMLSKEDKNLIKGLRVENGYGAKKESWIPWKTGQIAFTDSLLRSGAFCKCECIPLPDP